MTPQPIQLTEEQKRQIYLIEGMIAGLEGAKQFFLKDIIKNAAMATQPAPPAPEPPKEG